MKRPRSHPWAAGENPPASRNEPRTLLLLLLVAIRLQELQQGSRTGRYGAPKATQHTCSATVIHNRTCTSRTPEFLQDLLSHISKIVDHYKFLQNKAAATPKECITRRQT
jgi:hypothetical protein